MYRLRRSEGARIYPARASPGAPAHRDHDSPAGSNRGRHPLEKRRLVTAHVGSRHSCPAPRSIGRGALRPGEAEAYRNRYAVFLKSPDGDLTAGRRRTSRVVAAMADSRSRDRLDAIGNHLALLAPGFRTLQRHSRSPQMSIYGYSGDTVFRPNFGVGHPRLVIGEHRRNRQVQGALAGTTAA